MACFAEARRGDFDAVRRDDLGDEIRGRRRVRADDVGTVTLRFDRHEFEAMARGRRHQFDRQAAITEMPAVHRGPAPVGRHV